MYVFHRYISHHKFILKIAVVKVSPSESTLIWLAQAICYGQATS